MTRRYDNTDRHATACNWCGASNLGARLDDELVEIGDDGYCQDCADEPADRREAFVSWADLDRGAAR